MLLPLPSAAEPVPMRLRVDPAGSNPRLVDAWLGRGAELVTDLSFDTLWLSSDRALSEMRVGFQPSCTRQICIVLADCP